MLATQELICYQLRNNLYSHLDNPLKREIDSLSKVIKDMLLTKERIKGQSIDVLGLIFDLRMKAVKWLAKDGTHDFSKIVDKVMPQVREWATNKKLEILTENICFALRCNKRVLNSFMDNSGHSSPNIMEAINSFPISTYKQLITLLATAKLPDEDMQKFTDFLNSSLHIEFVMVAADIINSDKLEVTEEQVSDLSFLVADAAQEFYALAIDFGLLKKRSKTQQITNILFDPAFIKEQQELANTGLDDFAKSYEN